MGYDITLPNAIRDNQGNWTKDVVLDEMTGEEEDILADMRRDPKKKGKLLKSPMHRLTEILSRCTVSVGAMTRPEGADRFTAPTYFEKVWANAYAADRAFALIRLRQASLGDEYKFADVCPECGYEHVGNERFTLDLSTLEVTDCPIEVAKNIDRTLKLPSGKVLTWHPLLGVDENLLEEMKKKHQGDLITALLFTKCTALNGNKIEWPDLKRMTAKDRNCILQEFDRVEAGIDMTIVNTCRNEDCQAEFSTQLNVGSKDFFFPSAT